MALIDGSQNFNILQKSQNFKNLKKKFVLIFTVPKLGTLFFMISKKISDLKDIKFEISTALQFEPSQGRYWGRRGVNRGAVLGVRTFNSS